MCRLDGAKLEDVDYLWQMYHKFEGSSNEQEQRLCRIVALYLVKKGEKVDISHPEAATKMGCHGVAPLYNMLAGTGQAGTRQTVKILNCAVTYFGSQSTSWR